jgi:hypothetical protein
VLDAYTVQQQLGSDVAQFTDFADAAARSDRIVALLEASTG